MPGVDICPCQRRGTRAVLLAQLYDVSARVTPGHDQWQQGGGAMPGTIPSQGSLVKPTHVLHGAQRITESRLLQRNEGDGIF